MPEWELADLLRGASPDTLELNPELTGRTEPQLPKQNKYKAKKTLVDGITFHSRKESKRYLYLKELANTGEIEDLVLQPKFELLPKFTMHDGTKIRAMTYTADFKYKQDGWVVIEDVKSKPTQKTRAFRMSWKLMQYKFRDSEGYKLIVVDSW